MSADIERARAALQAISPDLPRDEWVRAGMAAHAAGLSFEDFDTWSAAGGSYEARAARDTWFSFKDGKGLGPGTLYKMAGQAGWRPKAGRVRAGPAPVAAKPRQAQARANAAEVWKRFEPAKTHAYIEAKQGVADGLRVVPAGDPLRIDGESVAGCLVVPVLSLAGGELLSLQFIAAPDVGAQWKARARAKGNDKKTDKPNLPGASMGAGAFIVGELESGGTAYVCEGIGTAWACWKATGAAAVACFGWGRVRAVAAELRKRDPSARLVLVPDRGKEAEAETIAREVAGELVAVPQDKPVNYDVNDLAAEQGHDALELLLNKAIAPPVPVAPVHPLARYIDLDTEPRAPRYVIPGFIGYGLVIFAGTHGVGKTTALLPLAMVAAGLHRHGDPLAPKHWRHVVYITEDTEQALRIVAGIVNFGGLGLEVGKVRERLHIVEARRLEPSYVAEVATTYREQYARTVDGVDVPPLVVMDTPPRQNSCRLHRPTQGAAMKDELGTIRTGI